MALTPINGVSGKLMEIPNRVPFDHERHGEALAAAAFSAVSRAVAVGRVAGSISHSVECVTVDGIAYETLPQSELDELRRAKRLRDEAIAALRGDANTHANLAHRCSRRALTAPYQDERRRAGQEAESHYTRAETCRAALRYLGAEGKG